jgi:predicted Fe-S protein YdhL (DUF1289 family)
MSNDHSSSPAPLTPCIQLCRLDPQGYCVGCRRSGEEIGRWSALDNAERWRLMRDVLPLRGPASQS